MSIKKKELQKYLFEFSLKVVADPISSVDPSLWIKKLRARSNKKNDV